MRNTSQAIIDREMRQYGIELYEEPGETIILQAPVQEDKELDKQDNKEEEVIGE